MEAHKVVTGLYFALVLYVVNIEGRDLSTAGNDTEEAGYDVEAGDKQTGNATSPTIVGNPDKKSQRNTGRGRNGQRTPLAAHRRRQRLAAERRERDERTKQFRNDVSERMSTMCKETNELIDLTKRNGLVQEADLRQLTDLMVQVDSMAKDQSKMEEIIGDIRVTNKATLSGINLANERNTRMSIQHLERAKNAIDSSIAGIGTIKAGIQSDPVDAVAVMQGITGIIGGILAVIPSPHARAVGIFFDIINGFLGVFGSKAAPSVEDHIREMGNEIIETLYTMEQRRGQAAERVLQFWYERVMSKKGGYSAADWPMLQSQLPPGDVGLKPLYTLQNHVTDLMRNARGERAFNYILLYAKLAQIRIQIQLKLFSIMPDETDVLKENKDRIEVERNDFQQETLDKLIEMLTDVNANSIMTLQYFIPRGFDIDSSKLDEELKKITYQEIRYDPDTGENIGDVIEFPDPREVPDGTYIIETAHPSRTGHYIHTTKDWTTMAGSSHWDQMIRQLPRGSTCSRRPRARLGPEDITSDDILALQALGSSSNTVPPNFGILACTPPLEYFKLGRKISMDTSIPNSKIRIATYDGEEDSKFKTMTFVSGGGKVTFFVDGKDNHGKVRNTITSIDVFEVSSRHPTSPNIDGMITRNYWRIIPLGTTDGDTIRAVIGQPDGNHFLYYDGSWHHCWSGDAGCTYTYVYALKMKTLTSDSNNEVDKGFIWTLRKQ